MTLEYSLPCLPSVTKDDQTGDMIIRRLQSTRSSYFRDGLNPFDVQTTNTEQSEYKPLSKVSISEFKMNTDPLTFKSDVGFNLQDAMNSLIETCNAVNNIIPVTKWERIHSIDEETFVFSLSTGRNACSSKDAAIVLNHFNLDTDMIHDVYFTISKHKGYSIGMFYDYVIQVDCRCCGKTTFTGKYGDNDDFILCIEPDHTMDWWERRHLIYEELELKEGELFSYHGTSSESIH